MGTAARVGFASLLLFAAACGGSIPAPKYPIPDATKLLERHEALAAGLNGIRAEARVDQRGSEGRVRGTVLMFVERSGRVRFDVMTQFGPIAILTSDGQRFAFSDLREKRYLTGETCPKNIARLLGVPLSAAETAHFLLGGTPILEHSSSELRWNDDGYYTAVLKAANGQRQELDFQLYPGDAEQPAATQRVALLRTELFDAKGERVWRVRYEDLRSVGDHRLPYTVHVEQTASRSDTLIKFKELTVNPTFRDEVFQQEPRAGMEEEEASCE
ncbi:MAG TPA: DUF4292 domain-containing protein [Polyangiales bacterium]|nr:DUF4292 domain-containing protein [Polyangiales bacterium]